MASGGSASPRFLPRSPSLLWILAAVLGAAGSASATHSSQAFPTTFLVGNPVEWVVLDALPTGPQLDTSPRVVKLAFDLTVGVEGTGAAPLRIMANGDLLLDTTFAHFGTQAYPGVRGVDVFPAGTGSVLFDSSESPFSLYSLELTFPLFFVPGCCTDISILLDQPGFTSPDQALELSDIVLDWSMPIPEPSSALLVALGLCALGVGRAGGRGAARCARVSRRGLRQD
jgi:hypothetical protein